MKLIQATGKDIPLIQELARRSWENAYAEILSEEQMEYMLSEMYSEQEIESHLQNPNYHYYLIEDENSNSYEGFIGYDTIMKIKLQSFTASIWFRKVKEKDLEKVLFNF